MSPEGIRWNELNREPLWRDADYSILEQAYYSGAGTNSVSDKEGTFWQLADILYQLVLLSSVSSEGVVFGLS